MKIYDCFNLEKLKLIVEKHAKFQKVMLVFDENFSFTKLNEIYSAVKEICIFNKTEIEKLDENEIQNGYKLLIFACSANSFFKLNLNLDEFINVFLPADEKVLPFFVNCNFKSLMSESNCVCEKNYIFLNAGIDISIIYSYFFNTFYACMQGVLLNVGEPSIFNSEIGFINQNRMLEFLKFDGEFVDLKILKQMNLDYSFLPYLDQILLFAFSLLIGGIVQKRLTLVDVYKVAKNDCALINKFYAKVNNEAFFQIIKLNSHLIKNFLGFGIKNLLNFELKKIDFNELNLLIDKTKNFCKETDSLFVYLYLFNIFGL